MSMSRLARSLPALIAGHSRTRPNAIAVECVDTGEKISWAELHRRSLVWADALQRAGVHPSQTVATLLPTQPVAYEVWLGCAWLKAIEVPINPEYRGEWLVEALTQSRAETLVISSRYLPHLATVLAELQGISTFIVVDGAGQEALPKLTRGRVLDGRALLAAATPLNEPAPPEAWDVACIIFTSGTTGAVKGVIMPWGLILSGSESTTRPSLYDDVIFYSWYAPYHLTGKGALNIAALKNGRLVLRERFSASQFWPDIRQHGCTATILMGISASHIYQQPPDPGDADNSLRVVLMTPVLPQVDEFKKRFDIEVVTTYGSTEVSAALVSHMRPVSSANARSCGRPDPEGDYEIQLVDEHDYAVAPGAVGEMVVRPRAPWTANLGYFGMPEATVAAWRNGWYHTGDAFFVDAQGDWFFVDRITDTIRRRGELISSFAIEQAANRHPDVLESAAVAVRADAGEDEVKLVVVAKPGRSLDPLALLDFLAPNVPKFAMPRFVEIVAELPKTQATLRVQKTKLRERGVTAATWDRSQL